MRYLIFCFVLAGCAGTPENKRVSGLDVGAQGLEHFCPPLPQGDMASVQEMLDRFIELTSIYQDCRKNLGLQR